MLAPGPDCSFNGPALEVFQDQILHVNAEPLEISVER